MRSAWASCAVPLLAAAVACEGRRTLAAARPGRERRGPDGLRARLRARGRGQPRPVRRPRRRRRRAAPHRRPGGGRPRALEPRREAHRLHVEADGPLPDLGGARGGGAAPTRPRQRRDRVPGRRLARRARARLPVEPRRAGAAAGAGPGERGRARARPARRRHDLRQPALEPRRALHHLLVELARSATRSTWWTWRRRRSAASPASRAAAASRASAATDGRSST